MPGIKVNGINLNYHVEGVGEPLLLIGGFNSNRSIWIGQFPVLNKYFRVITFDNRGAGRTEKQGPYSIQIMTEDAVGLLNRLNIRKTHVLGISLGGLIAQELAITHPDRVSKLVLACTYSHIDETSGPTLEIMNAVALPAIRMLDIMLDLTINRPFYRTFLIPLMRIRNRFADTTAVQEKLKTSYEHNTLKELSQIRSRTLIITGTSDRVIKPASSEILARKIPGAKLIKIDQGSHLFFIEMRKQFNRVVLDFLLENPSAKSDKFPPEAMQ
jgi:3-oxoadipate enol-lactonase